MTIEGGEGVIITWRKPDAIKGRIMVGTREDEEEQEVDPVRFISARCQTILFPLLSQPRQPQGDETNRQMKIDRKMGWKSIGGKWDGNPLPWESEVK